MGRPVQPNVMVVGTDRGLADIINRAKFCIDRFRGFGLRKGQSWGPPIGNRNRPYHALCCTNAHIRDSDGYYKPRNTWEFTDEGSCLKIPQHS